MVVQLHRCQAGGFRVVSKAVVRVQVLQARGEVVINLYDAMAMPTESVPRALATPLQLDQLVVRRMLQGLHLPLHDVERLLVRDNPLQLERDIQHLLDNDRQLLIDLVDGNIEAQD
jgi:hypothetical protein